MKVLGGSLGKREELMEGMGELTEGRLMEHFPGATSLHPLTLLGFVYNAGKIGR